MRVDMIPLHASRSLAHFVDRFQNCWGSESHLKKDQYYRIGRTSKMVQARCCLEFSPIDKWWWTTKIHPLLSHRFLNIFLKNGHPGMLISKTTLVVISVVFGRTVFGLVFPSDVKSCCKPFYFFMIEIWRFLMILFLGICCYDILSCFFSCKRAWHAFIVAA